MPDMHPLQTIIEEAFENRDAVSKTAKEAIHEIIRLLDSGSLRVAEKQGDTWIVHQWIKKAVLLFFKIEQNRVMSGPSFDKVPLKYADFDEAKFQQQGARIVPSACVRVGAYVAPNTILMPSFVNIGAYIDTGTMVDTWATVGSCAQIGKNVHLSGGVGIGGVLEPLQANPTIIEDDCFIGARSEIVEGVIVGKGAVISMGVFLGQSTRIYNRETKEISYGYIPEGAVVVPGNLPSADGKYSLYCAVIVKQVDAKTRSKVNLNELLREEVYSC
jgi:2,3,4,5-tetrahydropyridine-2,6-dicarboxylate N-succinyltransferase